MTGFLLDSHVLLWWQQDPETLLPEAKAAITIGSNQLFFSHASIWELNIKVARGRLCLPQPLTAVIADIGCHLLPIGLPHLDEITLLPHHHGDPFDRLLIAQARVEKLTLITRDSEIPKYPVATLAA